MSADSGEVITITLTDVDGDELHVRSALQYGATQRAKVRLVVGAASSMARVDDLIEAQLAYLGRTIGMLPPVIEVRCPGRFRALDGRHDG